MKSETRTELRTVGLELSDTRATDAEPKNYDTRISKVTQVRVRVTLRLTVSQSVCLGIEPNLGQLTRVCFLLEISCRQLQACNFSGQGQGYITTNSQSVSVSWCRAQSRTIDQSLLSP
jgi:hypothetical protein